MARGSFDTVLTSIALRSRRFAENLEDTVKGEVNTNTGQTANSISTNRIGTYNVRGKTFYDYTISSNYPPIMAYWKGARSHDMEANGGAMVLKGRGSSHRGARFKAGRGGYVITKAVKHPGNSGDPFVERAVKRRHKI